MDREKVIRSLETAVKNFERYSGDEYGREYDYARVEVETLEDAIALLKAQETRVMSLEDICESIEHDKRISVYLQQKDGICREPRPALYTNLYGEGIDLRLGVDYVDYGGWLEQIVLYTKEYLKTWCLWTSRPTDAQREKVKWE